MPKEAVAGVEPTRIAVDRVTLYKRRWRLTFQGLELAVDLDSAASHGQTLSNASASHFFQIEQIPEQVIMIPIPTDASMAAKIGWYLGNRHIPIEVREKEMVMENFPTLTDSLTRIGILYEQKTDILRCAPHSADHRH